MAGSFGRIAGFLGADFSRVIQQEVAVSRRSGRSRGFQIRKKQGSSNEEDAGALRRKTGGESQDEHLAASIARAWLSLPPQIRQQGWPSWHADCTEA